MGEKEIRRLMYDETNNISGGSGKTIVKVSRDELDKENLNFKPYLVLSNYNGKIIDSYDTFEEAFLSATKGEHYGPYNPGVSTRVLRDGKLDDHLFQSASGNDYYLILDWHIEV